MERLLREGHSVRVLTRDVSKARGKLRGQRLAFFDSGTWSDAIPGATGVVNLAGVLQAETVTFHAVISCCTHKWTRQTETQSHVVLPETLRVRTAERCLQVCPVACRRANINKMDKRHHAGDQTLAHRDNPQACGRCHCCFKTCRSL